MQIVVLHGDRAQAEWICQTLAGLHHHCIALQTDTPSLSHIEQHGCDLLVLAAADTHAGIALLHEMRRRQTTLPAFFIAEPNDEDAVVAALAAGTSDYIVKPLRPAEFRLRVQALLRHRYPEQNAIASIHLGPYAFDHRALRVSSADGEVRLTQKEFDLALLFFRHLGRPLARAFIREALWPQETDLPSRTVDTHVSRVRSKLRLRPENGFRLLPVYSFGYRLEQVAPCPR